MHNDVFELFLNSIFDVSTIITSSFFFEIGHFVAVFVNSISPKIWIQNPLEIKTETGNGIEIHWLRVQIFWLGDACATFREIFFENDCVPFFHVLERYN